MTQLSPKLLTITEAARTAPVSVSEITLRRAILRGDIPAIKVFGKFRLEPTAVEKFVRNAGNTRPSPAERCATGCGCEDGKGAAHEGPCVMEPSPAERMDDAEFERLNKQPFGYFVADVWAEARRARAEEARLDADIERSAESRNLLIDDYEAKLKKAEEERDDWHERVCELERSLRGEK